MLRKFESKKRGQQRMRWLNGIIDSMGMSLSRLGGILKDREPWYGLVHGGIKELDMT